MFYLIELSVYQIISMYTILKILLYVYTELNAYITLNLISYHCLLSVCPDVDVSANCLQCGTENRGRFMNIDSECDCEYQIYILFHVIYLLYLLYT